MYLTLQITVGKPHDVPVGVSITPLLQMSSPDQSGYGCLQQAEIRSMDSQYC